MSNKINYVNGMTPSIARKWLKFYFSDFFIRADINEKELRLDIYLKKEVKDDNKNIVKIDDFMDLDYFNQYWNQSVNNPTFKLFIMEGKMIEVN